MKIRTLASALVISSALGMMMPAMAEEPKPQVVELKDGSTLYLHPNGTGRMVDQHGKPMSMSDGVPMEAKDGRIIMMQNKHIWVQYGPPTKFGKTHKVD